MQIPKDILERITFKKTKLDPTEYVKQIVPLEPCPCGKILNEIRRCRVTKCVEPQVHWREFCYVCKKVSIMNENDWHNAHDLNAKLRKTTQYPIKK